MIVALLPSWARWPALALAILVIAVLGYLVFAVVRGLKGKG